MDFDRFKKIIENDTDTEMVVVGMNKPSKFKSIMGFIFSVCVLLFIIIFMKFQLNAFFLLVVLIDILCIIYFGLNLFTEKGIATPKYKEVRSSEKDIYAAMLNGNKIDDDDDEEYDDYSEEYDEDDEEVQ